MTQPTLGHGPGRPGESAGERWVSASTADQLRHLAFHGYAEHVRALFETLTPSERARQGDPEVLRQVALGSLSRVHALPFSAALELDQEREFLESVVQMFVSICRSRHAFPRELFRTLLDWSDELVRASRLSEAKDACTLALTLGVHAFPDLWPWNQLRIARTQALLGHVEAAHTTLAETYQRLDRIADRDAVPALLDALGTSSLQTRRASAFTGLLVDRLRVFHTNADERLAVVRLLKRVHRGVLRLLASRELSAIDKGLWLTCWMCLGGARRLGWSPASRLLETCAAGAAYVTYYGWHARAVRRSATAIDATLVTRAMGGLGDLLMMTPGLRALKAMRAPRPVVLAIPRRYFPLFDGNDDVQLMDIDDEYDPVAYREWFNLTDCPAARVESRTAPSVNDNRIELFARALGVTGPRLKAMDRRPRYIVSDEEVQWRDRFFVDHGLHGAFVIGVQARTDEAYRDVPHMASIVDALARHGRVVVFGSAPLEGIRHPGVIQAQGLGLRRSFALAGGCDVLVTPDSAFFHLAGALDLPSVGLFGPTDGLVRGLDYPRARVLDARRTLRCVPCWRNEATPCGLTGLRPSACLGAIAPDEVVRAVTEVSARSTNVGRKLTRAGRC